MKKLDLFSQRVLVIGIVVCAVLCSMALLLQASNSAFAQEPPPPNASATENLNGRFHYEPYQRVYNTDKGQFIKSENYIFVWDSQTGKCMDYKFEKGKFAPAKEQLPQPTLEEMKELQEQ